MNVRLRGKQVSCIPYDNQLQREWLDWKKETALQLRQAKEQTGRCFNINLCTWNQCGTNQYCFSITLICSFCTPPPFHTFLMPLMSTYIILWDIIFTFSSPSHPSSNTPHPMHPSFFQRKIELFVWCGGLGGCSLALWVSAPCTYMPRGPVQCICMCVHVSGPI